MVVHSRRVAGERDPVDLGRLDLAHLGLFLGLRVNELVVERGQVAGFRGLRESHGYIVQHLIESDRSITELAQRMEVSQQAASKAVAELVRLGYVDALAARDARQRRIRLSRRGWQAVRFSRRTRQLVETRLRRAAGPRHYDRAKRAILDCLDALGGLERVRARRVRLPR